MLDVSSEGVDTATKSIGVNGITAAASADPNYRHFLKPRFRVGDQVYAAWWPSDTSPASWYAGTVKSFCDVECNGNENSITYGPLRFYDVAFDDGDEQDDILDAFVFDRSDYLLTLRHQTWLGVKNVVDENSEDDWARVVGWYNAVIEGEERSFSLLLDALRAHDAYTVRQNGPTTKQSQLNLPEEWKFFFAHERRPPENKILCTRTSCDDSSKVAFELATYRLPSFESTGVDELLKQNDKTLSR